VSGSDPRIFASQLTLEQKRFWRNPASAVFTFAFPIFFLVIFNSLNSNDKISSLGGVAYSQYMTPVLVAFGLISACFVNIGINIPFRRDSGFLKRVRGTPLPPGLFLAGVIGSAVVIAAVLVVLLVAVGALFYDVTVYQARAGAFVLTLVVAAASFCAMGVGLSAVIPNADAAPAIVNAVFFPIVFISGTFYPMPKDSVVTTIANVFPVKHLNNALYACFDPFLRGSAFRWGDLAFMLLWGVIGAAVAMRWFRWDPKI